MENDPDQPSVLKSILMDLLIVGCFVGIALVFIGLDWLTRHIHIYVR
jgi:hypothetical protein